MKSPRSMTLSGLLACGALLGACATEPAPPPPQGIFDVSGEVNLARTRIDVYINGEQVVHGPLRVAQRPTLIGDPRRGGSRPEPFPLRGEFQGRPVTVLCEELPFSPEIACPVRVSGYLVETLTFLN